MRLPCGFLKCHIVSAPKLTSKPIDNETRYHLHARLDPGGGQPWDCAVNVGTDDRGDLLNYKLVSGFQHAIIDTISAAPMGFTDLTSTMALPALDVERSDIVAGTGDWQTSDVMDGRETLEPVASLMRLFEKARDESATVYVFGRTYTHGGSGIHDVHVNQGSRGEHFRNKPNKPKDHSDHNDVWQDGAFIVDLGASGWTAYFAAFQKQVSPTDKFGNPESQDANGASN